MTRRTVQPLAREQSSSSSSPFLFSCISTTVALVLFGALVLAAVADADPMVDSASSLYGDNKHASDKRPFFVGSRYGRSHVYGAKDMRQVNVVPRNDRFFLGSRYGKRSDLTKEIESDNNNGIAELTYLACLHTGVSNLYRCYSRDSSSNALHQQETEQFDQQQQQQQEQQQHQRQFNDNADLSEK
ncbi:RYamide neuropeptides [Anopheles gambiae]|uniref:RYamide neuropeptides n=1 Tax=Anopheles gambiae TaxID=7165 RepID=UPI002AC8F7D9|nr:RYamide neuropeptides [Anopheles gambiae]